MTVRLRSYLAGLLVSALLACGVQAADDPNRTVGPQNDGSIVASSNQTLTPAGTIVDLGSPVRAKAIALNPNSKTRSAAVLLMGAPQPVIVLNTATGQVLQRFIPTTINGTAFTSNKAGSFTGIAYSADGTKLFFSQDDNHVAIAKVNPQTGLLTNDQSLVLPAPPADGRPYYNAKAINPAGIAVSDDGKRAYVVLNAANMLGVIDLTAPQAKLIAQIPVGNAPNSIVIHGTKAYVSNEGGRPATEKDFTNLSDGTPIVVDRKDAFATTGTVSVVDLVAAKEVATIPVGLHPAGMTISGSALYVANAYSDSVSVIDPTAGKVVRTIALGVPIAGGAFGSGPNGIAVTEAGQAYVTLGQANAIAVINLSGRDANPVIGYIPTAYFPTSIAYDPARKQLAIADDKGLGARGSIGTAQGVSAFNTHQDSGVVNLIALPNAEQLAGYTKQVIENNHWNLTTNIEVGPRFVDPTAKPVAVPRRIGEPSLIKYVFLVVKENRTYDQMLGDVPQGNGDPSLGIFASATPNQHAFVQRFPLLDNVYAPSRQSADGHPWIFLSGSFYSNDILSPDWIRSYPGGNSDDPLTYTPRGFLWSAAAAKGLSVKLYGEWSDGPKVAKKPDGSDYNWSDFYSTALCKEKLAPASSCIVPDDAVTETSSIPSAAKILDPHYPSFNLTIPDQYRADYWIPVFERQVAANQVPNLTIIWLPSDHTNGTTKGFPYPINYQADNDLALGRMVEAISHSKVWGQSAIFVEEDDAQNGVDHVDGHRQPVYVISPYTAAPQAQTQGKVIHTTYTAENINRTIENILGMQPLTQFDLVASPMFDAFQDTPDLTPFTHLPAPIPLDQGPGLAGTKTGADTPLQRAWLAATWEVMKDKLTKADAADPNFLNHVTWYSATDWKRPYPGEKKLLMPGPFVKAAKKYHDDDD
ncbi:MAG TPA: bifunctional YncE family protein/alkaline phosphatase family protein [Rhizomicrobium sp.]|nr:bifunctional YncE family protein/alkaline phosphatase family protein [Rhizomicrobium sp.]